jgi:hypothetical protein
MRTNITNLLQKGNLSPKERSLMVVHNAVTEERDGKGFLSDADKYALVEGWHPKDNSEVREYNKYNGGWRTAMYAELDAQTTFLNAQNAFLRACIATSYYLHTDYERVMRSDSRLFDWSNLDCKKRPNAKDALESVLENSGLQRDYMVYRYAFELMDEELQQDLLKLYPDVKTESDYLYNELALYELLGETGIASDEAKDEIADMIAKRAYNEYTAALAEQRQKTGKESVSDFNPWSFHGYFADIPLLEVAKKCAEYRKLDVPMEEDGGALARLLLEKITILAAECETDIGTLIKQAARRYLDEGLLDEYPPLFLSDRTGTVNGEGTSLPHKEIFKRWLAARTKAELETKQMMNEGKLEVRTISDEVFGVKREQQTVLGKSLYRLEDSMGFIEDYKKQAEALVPVGFLFELIQQGELIHQYRILLGFEDIFKRLSAVYDIDLTYKMQGYLATIRRDFRLLNDMLHIIKEKYVCEAYTFHDCRYFMDVPQTCFVIDVEAIEPDTERLEIYYKEFQKTLGDAF